MLEIYAMVSTIHHNIDFLCFKNIAEFEAELGIKELKFMFGIGDSLYSL